MGSQNWITLTEYSAKYRVSISTLRRRIKGGELEFQFSDGKYLLRDRLAPSGSEVIAPPTLMMKPQNQRTQDLNPSKPKNLRLAPEAAPIAAPALVPPFVTDIRALHPTVEGLLSEIKKAYMQILQEKEEQILQLRSEVSDLKTLVGVLEEQNGQLKISVNPKFELDLDL